MAKITENKVEKYEEPYQSNKFTLCVLKTQVGKTFTAIARIKSEIECDDKDGRSLHIVFTMNTLLNNRQFAKRLEDIENTYGKTSVVILASKYEGNYKYVKNEDEALGLFIKKNQPRVLVMCSNTVRYQNGVNIVHTLNENTENTNGIKRIYVYYDELHHYINDDVRKQIETIHDFEITKGIFALTATPDKIWQSSGFWHLLRLHHFADFNDDNYTGFNTMQFHLTNGNLHMPYIKPAPFDFSKKALDVVEYANYILNKYNKKILTDTSRVFIPAHMKTTSHLEIKDMVMSYNWKTVVVVLNGVCKKIYFKLAADDTPDAIDISKNDDEVSNVIYNVLTQRNLLNRPLVYTGFICVGMGQTLVNENIGNFTSAILSHMDLNNDDIYQLFGRLTGRMKHWQKYEPTKIYCPELTKNRCMVMEHCSKSISDDHNGEIVSRNEYYHATKACGKAGKELLAYVAPEQKPHKTAEDREKERLLEIKYKEFDKFIELQTFAKDELQRNVYKRAQPESFITLINKSTNKSTNEKQNKPLSQLILELGKMKISKNTIIFGETFENKWLLIWRNLKDNSMQNTNTNATTITNKTAAEAEDENEIDD